MSQAISSVANCCSPCSETVNVSVPGPQGPAGADGTNGTNGYNSFSNVSEPFAQPAVGANVDVEVDDARWMSQGQEVFIQNGGYYLVVSVLGNVATLKNRGYDANVGVGLVVAAGNLVNPSGEKGETGADGTGSGDVVAANNLSDLTSSAAALVNLGGTTIGKNLFTLPDPSADGYLRSNVANTVTPRTYSDVRTDLGLVIGTNVQAWDTALDALSNGVTPAADTVPYFTGAGAATVTPLTSAARNLLDDASPAAQRHTLNVLTEYGLIFQELALDLNVGATDTAIAINTNVSRYRIDKIVVENASANLTTATLGVFTAAGGGGTTVVADQPVNALTASTKFLDLTLAGGVTADVLTAATLYLRVGTPQGAAATANVHVFGWKLN